MSMYNILNWRGDSEQNIFHFQGKARYHYEKLFDEMSQLRLNNDPRLVIVTCASDETLSPLINQYKQSNIPYVNIYRPRYYAGGWSNTLKMSLFIEFLKTLSNDQIVLFTDGYDVAVRSLDAIYDRFKQKKKRIVFNATKHNYPDVSIDRLYNRDFIGEFKYFNAGCCIGYAGDLLKFYEEAKSILDRGVYNPWDSEQLIIRMAWAKYSEQESDFIGIDSDCSIFQTLGSTRIQKQEDKYLIV